MEPRFFIPVVPTLLLNGSRGIGEKSLYFVIMNHMCIEISSNWNNNNDGFNNNNNNNDNNNNNNSMVFNVINYFYA